MLNTRVPTTGILWDLDNTLVAEMASYEAAFRSATRSAVAELHLDPVTLQRAVFGAANALWLASPVSGFCAELGIGCPTSLLSDFPGEGDELAFLRTWAPPYRRESWLPGLTEAGDPHPMALVDDLDRTFRQELERHIVRYDDVLPALASLRSSYRYAIATNGPIDVQRRKIAGAGLQGFFPIVVASSEVRSGKPHPRIFEVALEHMGLPATQVVVVGDSLEKDVMGAAAAGVRCIWVNRTGANAGDAAPAAEITTLADLAGVLG